MFKFKPILKRKSRVFSRLFLFLESNSLSLLIAAFNLASESKYDKKKSKLVLIVMKNVYLCGGVWHTVYTLTFNIYNI